MCVCVLKFAAGGSSFFLFSALVSCKLNLSITYWLPALVNANHTVDANYGKWPIEGHSCRRITLL